MSAERFLHQHEEFHDLLRIVAEKMSIAVGLVEKDYWIMHSLYGLQQIGLSFELKGGTSLSKGFGIIHRFSEDIDIRIEPPEHLEVMSGPNHNKTHQNERRKNFYDWLAKEIKIHGIHTAERDVTFDDLPKYRSGGIRLRYTQIGAAIEGLKDGVLLEVGFDDVTPNFQKDISSWAYDYANTMVAVIDNRAKNVACYHPGYTFVEKLQTVSTKFRSQQETGAFPINFLRHYYDIYCLLKNSAVQEFIGTEAYRNHKDKRFPTRDNKVIAENDAFFLRNSETRALYRDQFTLTKPLYYQSQPAFDEMLESISRESSKL